MKKIRVLQILVCLGSGGVETLLLNFQRRLPEHIHFDYLVAHHDVRDAEAKQYGSLIHVIPRERRVPWKHPQLVAELIEKYRYDVIHFHRFAFGGAILQTARQLGVPLRIAHSHHISFQESGVLKNLLYSAYHQTVNRFLLNRHATHILACSNEAGRFLMGPLWGRSAKCTPLLNGIELEKFGGERSPEIRRSLCERYGIPADAIVIGNLGRMAPAKNQGFLINAFAELAKRDSRYVLFIGGEGELRGELTRQTEELGLKNRVFMPGFCPNPLELFGNLFDVFCLPSTVEGFGIVLLEATASGLFSVCSRNVPSEPVDLFPETILSLPLNAPLSRWADALQEGIRRRTSSEQGLELVKNQSLTIDAMLETLLTIYESAASSEADTPEY